LGLSELKANETVQRFRAHDEASLLRQHAVKDDEKKLIQTGQESAEQLLQLFETDTDQPEEASARTGT
jgi:glutathione-regulated potassium-efflux system protein KefB